MFRFCIRRTESTVGISKRGFNTGIWIYRWKTKRAKREHWGKPPDSGNFRKRQPFLWLRKQNWKVLRLPEPRNSKEWATAYLLLWPRRACCKAVFGLLKQIKLLTGGRKAVLVLGTGSWNCSCPLQLKRCWKELETNKFLSFFLPKRTPPT